MNDAAVGAHRGPGFAAGHDLDHARTHDPVLTRCRLKAEQADADDDLQLGVGCMIQKWTISDRRTREKEMERERGDSCSCRE